jgi:hypothetical protein
LGIETAGQYADDSRRRSGQFDRRAHYARDAAEVLLPKLVANHHQPLALLRFFSTENTPKLRWMPTMEKKSGDTRATPTRSEY